MHRILELKKTRAKKMARMEAILKAAEADNDKAGRNLTEVEDTECKALQIGVDDLEARIARLWGVQSRKAGGAVKVGASGKRGKRRMADDADDGDADDDDADDD